MNQPFFSVVLATFNRGFVLHRAINSLLLQKESDFEVIIIDDGSEDDTFQIVNSVLKNDSRFHYYKNSERNGAVFSKNRGIRLAKGRYITFLDSDDEYEMNHLMMRKEQLLLQPECDFMHGGVKILGDLTVPDCNDLSKRILISECAIGGTFVLHNEFARKHNGFQEPALSSDYHFMKEAIHMNAKIIQVDFPTYIYHHDSEDSVTNLYF